MVDARVRLSVLRAPSMEVCQNGIIIFKAMAQKTVMTWEDTPVGGIELSRPLPDCMFSVVINSVSDSFTGVVSSDAISSLLTSSLSGNRPTTPAFETTLWITAPTAAVTVGRNKFVPMKSLTPRPAHTEIEHFLLIEDYAGAATDYTILQQTQMSRMNASYNKQNQELANKFLRHFSETYYVRSRGNKASSRNVTYTLEKFPKLPQFLAIQECQDPEC